MSSRLRNLNSTRISFFAFQDIITSVSGILILVTLILATALDRPAPQAARDTDPELGRKLSATLRQQLEVDNNNRTLQALLAAAETAPAAEKLEADITRLRSQLAEEKRKHATVAEQLAASQSALEARDRTLGFSELKAQIQQISQEAETLARQEATIREEMAALEQRVGSVHSRVLKLRQREGKLWLIPDKSSTSKEPILAIISTNGAKLERFEHPEQTRALSRATAQPEFDAYLRTARPVNQYLVFLVKPSGITLFNQLVKMAREQGFEVGFDALEEEKEVYSAPPPVIDETVPPIPTEGRTGPPQRAGSGGYSKAGGGYGGGPNTDAGRSAGAGSNEGAGTAEAENTPPEASTKADGNGRGAATNASVSAERNRSVKPTTLPVQSPAPKKSWWQRLLEWLGLR